MNTSQEIDYFYDLSKNLTGFNLVKLYGTGQGEFYLQTLRKILGEPFVSELLNVYYNCLHPPQKEGLSMYNYYEEDLIKSERYGPVCQNIIKMWYLGNWTRMSDEWRATYIASEGDVNKVLSKNSYIEGLVWKAMGKHPKSAKQPGYGTWAFDPAE